MTLRGLLVDWGGVLTSDVFASFDAFCAREGLPPGTVRELFRADPSARELLAGLEDGTLPDAQFEAGFAALLGPGIAPEGLIGRLMGDAGDDPAMLEFVRSARRAGIRTGLISNSWGVDRYDREVLVELFDGVVISGEVGLRKPAPEIYALGAEAVGLPPAACAYVDDLPGNLKPARALGMTTLHHRDADATIAALRPLLGLAS
ncbi:MULTISPECIES: HAD family hydrolase [Dactylosporangium]|uniref:Phosphoglycolate phosphatase n=2 Tax=Dactylosporangium TaxID=35753 RepID=A0A9W6NR25_9ACTN|nr:MULTISPECIES: HAD family phosphatase [Dactylosporangium]UAB94750.1 HAD family phosphatase [Dactylosporangium vinaceum]UWZ43121.1 HAD family phosphatase [Dactylosporangium matsuzakiense]GLL06790.1 phosphoglycolate phosphatase [Dactylosporangium matsuzakiense]